jgi:hypothetical protein
MFQPGSDGPTRRRAGSYFISVPLKSLLTIHQPPFIFIICRPVR